MEKPGPAESRAGCDLFLVMFNHNDRPDIEFSLYGSTLEQNKLMHQWYDKHSERAKEIIYKLSGVVLQENWFWPGLVADFSAVDSAEELFEVESAPNVSGLIRLYQPES